MDTAVPASVDKWAYGAVLREEGGKFVATITKFEDRLVSVLEANAKAVLLGLIGNGFRLLSLLNSNLIPSRLLISCSY